MNDGQHSNSANTNPKESVCTEGSLWLRLSRVVAYASFFGAFSAIIRREPSLFQHFWNLVSFKATGFLGLCLSLYLANLLFARRERLSYLAIVLNIIAIFFVSISGVILHLLIRSTRFP